VSRALLSLVLAGLVVACGSSQRPSTEEVTSHVAAAGAAKGARSDRQARVASSDVTENDFLFSARCPRGMTSIEGRFCIDRWEASLVEILPNGDERPHSPYLPVEGLVVRAVSEPNVYPQAYVSAEQAKLACKRSGKRLCKPMEWKVACMGPKRQIWGYGNRREERRCNDYGRSPVVATFGIAGMGRGWSWEHMNQPLLNQLDRTLARTGEHPGCSNDYGVYDMVGNLHEWVDDPAGTFQGGFYQDTHQHGDGCTYVTLAHYARYHDYSTGFRCCADLAR
jgi:hypothetical protein